MSHVIHHSAQARLWTSPSYAHLNVGNLGEVVADTTAFIDLFIHIVLMVVLHFEYSILGIMLTIANWLLPAYIFSEKGHQHMLKTVYPDEIDEWNKDHPDHEWAQEDWSKVESM